MQLSLGATLTDLTGYPAESLVFGATGEAEAPAVRAAGDDLILQTGDSAWLRIGHLGVFVHEP